MRRAAGALGAGALVALASGCGVQSPLDPHSRQSHDIEVLWWWMLVAASIVFAGAVVLLLLAWWRRGTPGLPLLGKSERANNGLVVLFGMVIPAVVLVALFIVSNLYVIDETEAPASRSTSMTVTVIGHQWFWEVRYPGTTAVTANEIHIPARTRVNLVAKTADVIHSFWVPQLNRKIDMIPGRTNRILLDADDPGVYRGQCAEFCGLQHAHMVMKVFAQPPSQFRRWLANMSSPAAAPATPQAAAGRRAFDEEGCAGCHTIRGTRAAGGIGPDLTHLATRTTIAGATLPNTPAYLRAWIEDPQHFKPGNKMPSLNLSRADVDAIATYLEGLR